MTGLAIIVATPDPSRFRAALTVALTQAALGQPARLYCHENSVSLLARAHRDDDDTTALAAAGLPDRLQLLAMAHDAGVDLVACQTGLALCGLVMHDLVDGVDAGGLLGVLAELGDDRLLSF